MTPETTPSAAVRLRRTIPAPPDRVYRAWLDPELVQRWFSPGEIRAVRVEVDERVGGAHRTWQVGPDGEDVGGFDCELLELVPGERIVFLWRFVGPGRVADPAHDSRLTVTLRETADGQTDLELVHDRLETLIRDMPEVGRSVQAGWAGALEKLPAGVA